MPQSKSKDEAEHAHNEAFYAKKDWLLFASRFQPGFNGPQVFLSRQKRKSSTLEPILAINTATCQTYPEFTRLRRRLLAAAKSVLLTPFQIMRIMAPRAKYAKNAFGRSYRGQYADIFRAWWYADLQPQEYYEALLARHQGGPALFEYFDADLVFRVVAVLQLDLFGEPALHLNDKALFGKWLAEEGLPGAAEFAVTSATSDIDPRQLLALGKEIIIKPNRSGFGRRVEVWTRKSDDRWTTPERELSTANLIAHVKEQAQQLIGGVVVQERLHNHSDLAAMTGKGLATCRFITMRNENSDLEVVMFYWRMAWPGSNVDNYHAGGFYWITDDNETGVIVHGVDTDTQAKQRLLTHHPVTGAYMIGFTHPNFAELRALALKAHEKLPDIMFAGWDVAMTTQGPKLIELNTPCSFPPRIQMTTDGLGQSRCGQILAHYARTWLELPIGSRTKPPRATL
ncbi:MAG: sugar-transfer associated ATP-grasp domain-containing protein [Pseudomonadota bacterium]